ncbi:MAG: hypothetical protein ACRDQU_16815 [Pseudonocardiaceae bacterium]
MTENHDLDACQARELAGVLAPAAIEAAQGDAHAQPAERAGGRGRAVHAIVP